MFLEIPTGVSITFDEETDYDLYPSSTQMLEVTKSIDQGAGVLYIYRNYGGDIHNFDMAAEMADTEGEFTGNPAYAGGNLNLSMILLMKCFCLSSVT